MSEKSKAYTAKWVMQAAHERCGTNSPAVLIPFLAEQLSRACNFTDALVENERDQEALHDTVVACLVAQLGGEARIDRASLEEPPTLETDDDPETGEWIYRTVGES